MDSRLTKKPSTVILIALISSPSFGATLFTPAMPAIMDDFNISEGASQFSLTIFVIGYALGQLIYGPFAIRFGRKPVIYFGLFIAVIGSLLSALSAPFESYGLLLFGRIVTAFGASVGLVLTYTIINDCYNEQQARRVVPVVSAAFAVIPFLGVAIGGVLVERVAWQSCFYFLFFYYLAVLYCTTFLPETANSLDRSATKISVVIAKYQHALGDSRLLIFSILYGLTTVMVFIFSASAPIVAVNTLGMSAQDYGFLAFLISFSYLSGNLCSAGLSKKFSAMNMIGAGVLIFGPSLVALFGFSVMGYLNIYTFFIPFFCSFFGISLAYTNVIVMASSHYEDRVTGSSLMNFISMSMAVLGVVLIEVIPGPLVVKLPIELFVIVIGYCLLFLYSKRFIR
ncbi:MAG: hypothetical protein COB36_14660 [Alphaproteobacteria bacterium]|nr:MAG: hypothetical protein COB36_14660 [Alphaproteobacteria bacterium]